MKRPFLWTLKEKKTEPKELLSSPKTKSDLVYFLNIKKKEFGLVQFLY
jgi:hypothetical protein